MSNTMKLVLSVVAFFASGFILVGLNKKESPEKMEAASMIRNYTAMQEMANDKCKKAILQETGEQIYFPSDTQSDKETYVTMKWQGENAAKGGFKDASCTLSSALGGISELVIDGKTIVKK